MSVRQLLQSIGLSAFGLATALSLLAFQAQAATTLPTGTVTRIVDLEDVVEAVADGEIKPPKSIPKVKGLTQTWPPLRAELRTRGVPEKNVAALDRALTSLQAAADAGTDMRRPANEVTGAIAPLFAMTGDTVPVEVHTNDYLNRSLVMDAKEASWSRADADSAALAKNWEQLRPRVLAADGGKVVATQYDSCVQGVGKAAAAKDAAALDAAAQHCNDIGDRVSRLF